MNPVRQKALDLLSRREHSIYELRVKLQKRGFTLPDINAVLEVLQAQGWLNHDRFIESTLRRSLSLGYGPLKVLVLLRTRGIADAVVCRHPSWLDIDWIEHLKGLCRRLYPEEAKDRAAWLKRARFLQSRGFTVAQIKQVLVQVLSYDIE